MKKILFISISVIALFALGAGVKNTFAMVPPAGSICIYAPELCVANQPPTATFTYTPPNPVAGVTSVRFDATGSGDTDGTVTDYKWDLGNGVVSHGVNADMTYYYTYPNPGNYTVTLTATDNLGAITISTPKTITVSQAPPTITSFTATPASIAYNTASTLKWATTNATSCTSLDFTTGGAANNNTNGVSTDNLTATKTYNISCTGPGGTATATATVTVGSAPLPTATLTATPANITPGASSLLTWATTNATSCTSTDFNTSNAANNTTGVSTGNLTTVKTYTYNISCTGAGGTATASATVTVTFPVVSCVTNSDPNLLYGIAGIRKSSSGGNDSFAKLLVHANTDFADSSAGARLATKGTGAAIDTATKKLGAGSGKFDGTLNGYVSYPDSDDWDFTGDFTIDGWVNINYTAGNIYEIASQGNSAGSTAFWALQFDARTSPTTYNGLWFSYRDGLGGYIDAYTGSLTGWNPNTWYHIAVARNGSNWYIFRDSVLLTATKNAGGGINDAGSSMVNLTSSLYIGIEYYNGALSGPYKGNIDELRISKGIARWTGNFTPPSIEYFTDNTIPSWQYSTAEVLSTCYDEYRLYEGEGRK